MPIYHLHLHNAITVALDEEGHDLPDIEAAVAHAVAGIRGLLGHEAIRGKIDLRGQIDITDEHGAVLRTVQFKDAVEIITR